MAARRRLIVAAAIALALLAGLSTFLYLRGLERRAFDDAELVEVFVVSADVPKGLPGDQAIATNIKASRIPAKFRPSTALTSLEAIKGKVALTTLSVNTVIVEGQFVDPRQAQVTFSQRIPAGNVAVTVSVDQVRGVAGLLVPGDRVNILAADAGAQRLLYQNVEIIAIGTTAAPQAGETAEVANPGSGLITFAVPPEAAARIVYATQQGGGIYLTLVPPDNPAVPVPPVGANNLFGGSLTPYGR